MCPWSRAGPSNNPLNRKGPRFDGALSSFQQLSLRDLLERPLHALAKLVTLFACEAHLGPRLRQLIPQPLDLGREIANARIRSAAGATHVVQLDAHALDCHLELSPLRKQLLNERL